MKSSSKKKQGIIIDYVGEFEQKSDRMIVSPTRYEKEYGARSFIVYPGIWKAYVAHFMVENYKAIAGFIVQLESCPADNIREQNWVRLYREEHIHGGIVGCFDIAHYQEENIPEIIEIKKDWPEKVLGAYTWNQFCYETTNSKLNAVVISCGAMVSSSIYTSKYDLMVHAKDKIITGFAIDFNVFDRSVF